MLPKSFTTIRKTIWDFCEIKHFRKDFTSLSFKIRGWEKLASSSEKGEFEYAQIHLSLFLCENSITLVVGSEFLNIYYH